MYGIFGGFSPRIAESALALRSARAHFQEKTARYLTLPSSNSLILQQLIFNNGESDLAKTSISITASFTCKGLEDLDEALDY